MGISGYVPFYNNAATVLAAVDSLRQQEPPLDEVFAINDGSFDNSNQLLIDAGVKVVQQPGNLGRGAARKRAMEVAQNEFVLCCDATNTLPTDFAIRALRWFDDPKIAAVFGLITDPNPQGPVSRWRARKLFKADVAHHASKGDLLITFGTMVRASLVAEVGGFDARLRHTEDFELGKRLARSSYGVISDPCLPVFCNARNNLGEVLERFWRWHVGKDEQFNINSYLKMLKFSIKAMAWEDLQAGDPLACGISLLLPHYQLWKFVQKKISTMTEWLSK